MTRLTTRTRANIPVPSTSHQFDFSVGDTLFEEQDYAGAILFYQALLPVDSQHPQLWQRLGESFLLNGQHAEAMQAFEKAILLDSQDSRSNYHIAMLHALQENHRHAKEYLRAALRLRPGWRNRAREDPYLRHYL